MAHVFAYIEHYQEDLFWSFLSDSFFTVGGSIYVLLSCLGLRRSLSYSIVQSANVDCATAIFDQ